jgi:hypothetical protein
MHISVTGETQHLQIRVTGRVNSTTTDDGTTQLKTDDALKATEFPNELNGYLYRVEKDKTVSTVDALGKRIQFRNWREFWDAAHPQA